MLLEVNGSSVQISPEDVFITTAPKEGWVFAAQDGVSIWLDTNLTEELIEEGKQREAKREERHRVGRDFLIQ